MRRYGICMEGNEPAFERAMELSTASVVYGIDSRLVAVEIGTATGRTTRGMAEYWRAVQKPFSITTLDIPGGWTLDEAAVHQVVQNHPEVTAITVEGGVKGLLSKGEWPFPRLHFGFIDGCHGAPCVAADFMVLAPFVVRGGILVFHDTSPECQGRHFQPHCGTGISVRRALHRLGLLTGRCPGWQMIDETQTPNGIAVFQRVESADFIES